MSKRPGKGGRGKEPASRDATSRQPVSVPPGRSSGSGRGRDDAESESITQLMQTTNISGGSGSAGSSNLYSAARWPTSLPAEYYTARDPSTSAATVWEISPSTTYIDLSASIRRPLNLKHIRTLPESYDSYDGGSRTPRAPAPPRDGAGDEYKFGTVIEVVLVPPPPESTVSDITPTPGLSSELGLYRRVRRFVIIEVRPGERNSFQALAIKTYDGDGVGGHGTIKSHHAIVHTTREAPLPTRLERPKVQPQGGLMEGAMQPHPIRVVPENRGRALDPLSRLDFGDRYEFDFGVPHISVFGQVHKDSRVALMMQYRSVWAAITRAGFGPVAPPLAPGSNTVDTSPTVTWRSNATSVTSERTAATAIPANTASPSDLLPMSDEQMRTQLRSLQRRAENEDLMVPGINLSQQKLHHLAIYPQARSQYVRRIASQWRAYSTATSNTGPITDDQMRSALSALRSYALDSDLTMPGMNMTPQRLNHLARNPGPRMAYLRRIRSQWKAYIPAVSNTGRIMDAQVRDAIRSLRSYAEDNGLPIPDTNLSQQRLNFLATNADARTTFFKTIRDPWDSIDDDFHDNDSDDDDDSDEEEDDNRGGQRR